MNILILGSGGRESAICKNIYNANLFCYSNITNPQIFKRFSYALLTVPTSSKIPNQNSVQVARIKNLTGGNYWGKESLDGVALSFSEYFGRNFSGYFNTSIKNHIKRNLQNESNIFQKFLDLNF